MAKEVRLYQFFNFEKDQHGMPFELCDRHYKSQVVPHNCILNKIADKAVGACRGCIDELEVPDET